MNDADRKDLQEAMGEKRHKGIGNHKCSCGGTFQIYGLLTHLLEANRSFNTWQDFGAVKEWAEKQEWWEDFVCERNEGQAYRNEETINDLLPIEDIDPIRFPELILEWGKETDKEKPRERDEEVERLRAFWDWSRLADKQLFKQSLAEGE